MSGTTLKKSFGLLILMATADYCVHALVHRLGALDETIRLIVEAFVLTVIIFPFIYKKYKKEKRINDLNVSLRESEGKYHLLFDENPSPMWVFDMESLSFLEVNDAACRHYGYTREEFLRMKVTEIRPPEAVPRLLEIIHSIPSDLQYAGVWKHRKKDGALMDMEMTAKKVDFNGRPAILALANDITDKISSETALKESERRFREVLESVRLVAVTLDREGRIMYSNDFLSDLTGWSREELKGKDWFGLFIPRERQDVREVFLQMIGDGDFPAYYENPILTRSGRERLISWNNTVFRDADGKVLGVTCLGEDITDWSEAEALVLKTNERLAMLNRIDKAMVSNPRLEGIAEVLLESLAGALGMESGAFYVFDPASDSLKLEGCFNYGFGGGGSCLSLSSLPGALHAIDRREPAAVERLDDVSSFSQSSGIKSYLLLPLIHKERLHGVICIFNTSREHSFTGDEMSFARQVADQAVIAIMNAELIKDLKDREAALIETNTELTALNGISSVISETLDLAETLQRVLDKTLSFPFLELQKKGIIFVEDEKDPGTFIMAASTGVARTLLEQEETIKAGHCLCGLAARTGEVVYSEDCFSDPRHTTHYPGMHEHGHIILPLKSKDHVLGVMALYLSSGARVTGFENQLLTGIASQLAVAIENRRLFQSILTGKKEWEATFDSIEDAITIHGPDYRILRANKAASGLLGLRPQDIIGRKCHEVFHGTDKPMDSCPVQALIEGRAESVKGEYESGGRFYEVNAYPVKQGEGLTAIVHVVKDITERRLAHEALVHRLTIEGAVSEASSLLLSGGNIDFEVILAVIGESVGTEKACLLFLDNDGKSMQEAYCWDNEGGDRGRDGLKSLGHADLAPLAAALMERQEILVEDASALPAGAGPERAILAAMGVNSFLAVPLRHGEKLYGFISFGTSGEKAWSKEEVSFIQYAAHDILSYLDRRKAEKALKESEEKFRKLVEQSLVGVYIMQDDRFKYINPRFAEIFGYEFGEVIDRLGPHEIILPEYWPAIEDSVRRRMEGDMTFAHYEFLGLRKDRDVINVEVFCSGTMYNGRPAVIGTLTDVTDRKQYERKLNDQARNALLAADIGTALASGASLRPTLQECTDAMVVRLNAALARIWTFNEKEGVLELQASSGMYTNLDGTNARIPLGKFRVGAIGAKRESFLTNDVLGDPLTDQNWARREGVTAFAGYPLIIENKLLGVMAMFAKDPLPDPTLKALGSVADIIAVGIEGRKIEAKLKESEKKFRNLVERSLTGVYIIQDGVFRYVNPRFAEIFEYNDPGLIDGVLSPQDIASPEDKAFVEENVRKCSSGDVKALNYIFRAITRSGRVVKVEVYDSNTVFDGSPAVIGTLMDITERIKAQEELIEREREMAMLQQAKKQVEEISRLKSEFLANMSHELRTPLNAVIGLSNILLDETFGPLIPKQAEYLKGINSSGEHLLSLINEILDLSKIEAGKEELDCAAFSLAETLKNSFLLVKEKAMNHRIELHSGVSPEVGAFYGDERRVKQIIFNLLSNAIKFTEPGGKVGITAFAADGEVSITVWDTGIGIPEEKKHLLFQPFQQLDSSLSKKHEGTGLGLVLTKKLVEMHSGRITFDSTEGKGSSFTVCLPVKEYARQDMKPKAVNDRHRQMPLPISKTIMVVEDNELNMLLASDFLRSKGFTVAEAMDGESALEMIKEDAPDLILMDIQMPGIDGLEVAKRLKAAPATKRIPIVAMTALAMKGDEELCLKRGCDGYIKKPINLKEMLEVVNSHLAGKKRTDV